MKKAVKIDILGTKEVVEFTTENSYETIKEAVDGWIERIWLDGQQITMWVNEEGKLNGLIQNPIATALWVDEYGYTDITVGNVIITGGADEEGNDIGLTDEQVEYLLNYNKMIAYTPEGFVEVPNTIDTSAWEFAE
jgi:hypothetical protein